MFNPHGPAAPIRALHHTRFHGVFDAEVRHLLWPAMLLTVAAGCAATGPAGARLNQADLKRQALACLKAGLNYEANPVVRVQAVEGLRAAELEESRPWIRAAILDPHPAVRFAACVAVGELRDELALEALRERVRDTDASVRVAAMFALHRLGHVEHTGRIPNYLLDHPDSLVRRNAAILLGLLEERSATKVLARAMQDKDPGVRHQSLEALARLGVAEARQELVFLSNSGVGADEVFAITALASSGDARLESTFRYKYETATHTETRLAAVRALAKFGGGTGREFAERALRMGPPRTADPQDTPEGQVLRVRQLAAAALGAIADARALPALSEMMNDPRDPRLQVSGARAILEIIRADHDRALSIPAHQARGGA